jgi:alkylation response protein AidB-like acyl-CoA dehydrogenase
MMGRGLRVLNRIAGSSVVDKLGLRKQAQSALYHASHAGFRTAGAASRVFQAVTRPLKPARLPRAGRADLFDLTPTEDQQMLRESVRRFADERLRPAAAAADHDCAAPKDLLEEASGLGIAMLGIPDEFGGAGGERSAISNVLVAEALAHGEMGLALACLAPAAVSTALTLWGDESQQSTYLPAFAGEKVPAAALAILEPRPLFDPFVLELKARRVDDGFVLDGLKSLVPRAGEAELFVVAATLEGAGPALFLVESSTRGVSIEAEPAMGLRAASLGRLMLRNVKLPAGALLGGGDAEVYRECVHLGRLGWCALATGTAQAVLDYVIPYVNERVAFGEPVSHRQSVAFAVANIGIELEGMRLATWRAASRAERGESFAREAALARRLCVDKGMAIGSDGVQLLGGHGFVKEHPVERWYRNLRAVGVMEGALLV